ncbi:MAG TPA: DnaJ domain-containing protein [Polyangiales bacterium]|nr:DnaJ domain-containing protein [Polyangiales bacterium]
MSKSLDDMDYYSLLGVASDASADAIKQGFRAFARRFHPDRFAGHPEHVAEASSVYRRATEAYRVLTNLEQRRLYDEQRSQGRLRFDPALVRRSVRPSGIPGHPESYSARARPFVAQAEQALKAKNYKQAKLNLQIALQHDAGNEALARKLSDVTSLLAGPGPAEP